MIVYFKYTEVFESTMACCESSLLTSTVRNDLEPLLSSDIASRYTFFQIEGNVYYVAGIRHDSMSSPQNTFWYLNRGDGTPA